jgi:hypothetical protein
MSLAPGSLVQLRLTDSFVLGEVRHCAAGAGCFTLGIRIDDSMARELGAQIPTQGENRE